MRYCLTDWFLGDVPRIEIDAHRFNTLLKSRKALEGAYAIEEKYDLLLSNYLDLERAGLHYATEWMVKGSLGHDGFADATQSINRRVVNLLTSARLYVDHVKQNIKLCVDNANIDRLFSEQYNRVFEYRFMDALRNHAQHCGLPVHNVTTPMIWTSEDENAQLEFGFIAFSNREIFQDSGNFKAQVLKEMPEKVEIFSSTRSYIAAISSIHESIRQFISANVDAARSEVELAINDYKAINSGDAVGLMAIKYESDTPSPKRVIEKFPVLLSWDDTRISLKIKNKQLINLNKRYVSSGSYIAADKPLNSALIPGETMSIDLNYGFGNARKLLEKVKRDQSTLYDAIMSQNPESISDAVFNFAVTGYHIKDWLKSEGVPNVENYINQNPMLRLCADLCNGSKHKLLTNPRENNDPVTSINNSELTCDMTTITCDAAIPINGHTVRMALTSGKKVEILDFAKQVVASWESFFSANNI